MLDTILSFSQNLIAFIVVLGVLVLLHEAGHFLVARALKARADVFSVGFGKRIWGFRRGETDYRLSLIPLGGYVRIPGLGPDESSVVGGDDAGEDLLPKWKRTLILLAGPVTNVIAAVFFLGVAFVFGIEVPVYQDDPSVVGWVEPESPGAEAGILPGDRIVVVDGSPVNTWRDLKLEMLTAGGRSITIEAERDGRPFAVSLVPLKVTRYEFGYAGILPPVAATVSRVLPGQPAHEAGVRDGDVIVSVNGAPAQFYNVVSLISPHGGEPVSFTFLRDGEQRRVQITPSGEPGEGRIGVQLGYFSELRQLPIHTAFATGVTEARRMTVETFKVIGKLLTWRASVRQTMSGPIDIARISGDAARSGLRSVIWLLGVISLQLGIFNLLPIPVLDGGHLAILTFESAIRRDLSFRVKERILEVGFVLLILLMVVVLYNDIAKGLS